LREGGGVRDSVTVKKTSGGEGGTGGWKRGEGFFVDRWNGGLLYKLPRGKTGVVFTRETSSRHANAVLASGCGAPHVKQKKTTL